MRQIIIIFLGFFLSNANAQELVNILQEKVTVNSTTSLNGWSRNTVEAKLPAGTIGYVYRLSVFKKDGVNVSTGLFDLLKMIPVKKIQIGANLSQFVINNSDGGAIDYFIFTTDKDKNAFYNKQDGNWYSCKSFPNRVSTCTYSDECINKTIWFGFRNNNLMQGLDVYIELAAIVDQLNSTNSMYGFQIINKTNVQVNFQLSINGINWFDYSLQSGYLNNYNFYKPDIFFRILTQGTGTAQYKINFSNRYKIEYNQAKRIFDLFND
jgi:hypothetical protein